MLCIFILVICTPAATFISLVECNVLYLVNWTEKSKCVSHRQPAADVSDEEEGIVFEVAHHGVAAAQLCGPTVPLMVVADAAIPHHGQNKWEDPLVVTGEKGETRKLN